MTDAEKKAKKKARNTAPKVRDGKKVLFLVHMILSLTFWVWLSHFTFIQRQGTRPVQPKDDDPDGLKQLGATESLEQAYRLLKHPGIDMWIAVYDVAIWRSKLS